MAFKKSVLFYKFLVIQESDMKGNLLLCQHVVAPWKNVQKARCKPSARLLSICLKGFFGFMFLICSGVKTAGPHPE